MKNQKSKGLFIISIIMMLVFSASGIYFYQITTSGKIPNPKTIIPSKKMKKTVTARELVEQMMKDMYPQVKLKNEVKSSECLEQWCYTTYQDNSTVLEYYYHNTSVFENPQVHAEESIILEVYKSENDAKARDSKQVLDDIFNTKIKTKTQRINVESDKYYFMETNNNFYITNRGGENFMDYKAANKYNTPVGFKKALPLKEYFEKIQFED